MRKALCVGIDNYKKVINLNGCVNDANSVKTALERDGDGNLNFNVRLMTATNEYTYIDKHTLRDAVKELFRDESEIALFYYSGHGSIDETGGYLCTSEIERPEDGLALQDVMTFAANSKAHNKVIILDSCHSGAVAQMPEMKDYSILHSGTTILAACGEDQYSIEKGGHGVFTSLLVEALYGGGMNLLGEVSPGSIYAYIDRSLGGWDQRPVFKANIKTFVSIRKNIPPIQIDKLRKITELFTSPSEEYRLDPTYEPDKHEADVKEVNKEHEAIFSLLQKYVKLNLVVPVGEEHMYYAALHHKSCKLTAQGRHYWNLVSKGTI